MNNTFFEKPFVFPSLIVAVGLIVAVIIGGSMLMKVKSQDSFAVTGSATMRVTSDIAKLSGTISRTIDVDQASVARGYADLAEDLVKVKTFFRTQGVPDAVITIDAPSLYEQNTWDNNGNITSRNYNLSQQISINSPDIATVEKASQAIADVVTQGVYFQMYGPEYYYSKLPDARITLLGEATKDAQNRAESIGKNVGKGVGALRSASVGVVQVLTPNSTDISDYGTYDTSTIEKDIMVTVRAEFSIR
jgi:hypothetical protein